MSIKIENKSNDVFSVIVSDTNTTNHMVTVTDETLLDLTDNRVSKTSLLEFPFKFLLDREPNT